MSAILYNFKSLYITYVCRHSYFLCLILFVFRRSPARLAGDRRKTTIFAARNEDDRLVTVCLIGS
ncbi:MAG: hypothetical protein EP145_12430 [Bacteroides uniformis]|nr:hypothetical protein [Bacteroides uniformis]